MVWMKSWGAGGGAGGMDEKLGGGRRCCWHELRGWRWEEVLVAWVKRWGREEVLVALMKSWGAVRGAAGSDEELGGGRKCGGSG